MTPTDSTNDQNTHQIRIKYASYASKKKLETPYLQCYTRNICKILRVET